MTSFNRFTSLVVVVSPPRLLSAAENWPQWRGPGSQGISTEAALADRVEPDQEYRVEN